MSKERARAREARQSARAAEVAAAAARRERSARRAATKERLALPKKRRQRYGALPGRVKAQLVAVFFAVQVVVTVFTDAWQIQIVAAVVSAAVLAVYVKTRRRPAR